MLGCESDFKGGLNTILQVGTNYKLDCLVFLVELLGFLVEVRVFGMG